MAKNSITVMAYMYYVEQIEELFALVSNNR